MDIYSLGIIKNEIIHYKNCFIVLSGIFHNDFRIFITMDHSCDRLYADVLLEGYE